MERLQALAGESISSISRLPGIALLALASTLWVPARACECGPTTPEAAFAESDAVFSATVAAIVEDGSILHVFVDLLEVWKGEFPIGQLVRVDTADNPAACGFAFQLGEEYVIFAYQVSGILNTDICTATGLLLGPLDLRSAGDATSREVSNLADRCP